MRLIIRDDANLAAKYVAEYIINRIKTFAPTPSTPFVLGLPTGSTPVAIYSHLVSAHKRGLISFAHVHTFNMDEYIALPPSHPSSYRTFMYTHLFSHVDIPPAQIHMLDGCVPDLEAECERYESEMRALGGVELFLGGIGPDGHLAFNEPGSSLRSRTRVKTLAYDTMLANRRFFGGDVAKVPRMALTVGIQTVLEAREVVIVITGAHKALALQKCIEGGVNHMWTLSALQMHQHPMIVVDEDATLELQVKTVKYFKSIEAVASSQGFAQVLPTSARLPRPLNTALPTFGMPLSPVSPVSNGNGLANGLGNGVLKNEAAGQQQQTLLQAPAEYPVRSITPELVPDSMASRIEGAAR